MLEKFAAYFTPDAHCLPASAELIDQFDELLPEALRKLWHTTGLGKYNDGLIEFIDPNDFMSQLSTWLGWEPDIYLPFAINGFGELFYYRKLSDADEDVCVIDIQFHKIEVLIWDFEGFLDDFLTEPEDRKEWLREKLFQEAISNLGKLEKHEVFTFNPIFALGGTAALKHLQKGNAQVYQQLVFEMT